MTDDLPFERAPRETVKAWTACLEYCRMGRERSAENVAKARGRNSSLFIRWCTRWNWVARAALWDAQEQKRVLKLWQDRRDEVRQADWDMAGKLRLKVQDMLAFPIARKTVDADGMTTIIEPARWTQGDTARIADTASKLARLAAMMETERKAVSESDIDAKLEELLAGIPPHSPNGDAGSSPEEAGTETTESGETS